MAQDEGRFGRISQARRAWAPLGIRPRVPQQLVREYIYAYAAVCPGIGRMTALILPYANTEMMNIFLVHVSGEFVDSFIIMLVDRAGWHSSATLKLPENIRLIQQPAYSPELNPVEHIWDELREKNFPNQSFKSLDEVEDELCLGLNELSRDPYRLQSLTNFPYLNVTRLNAT